MIAVADLEAAARELETRHGLASIEGGRHAGWGTANRIVPLGDTYLELIAVVDEQEAAGSVFGSWVARAGPVLAQPLGWAVRTHELDDVAARLGLTVTAGSRPTADGRVLRWRVAGLDQSAADPSLPFFLAWERGTPFPGRARASDMRIAEVEVGGDPDRLADWLGPHDLPLAIRRGTPAVRSVRLAGPGGEVVVAG